jgi:hypothetical protein
MTEVRCTAKTWIETQTRRQSEQVKVESDEEEERSERPAIA